ncbi:hypothetical protein GCM10027037_28820 [Mucilaginibacter koreensis]
MPYKCPQQLAVTFPSYNAVYPPSANYPHPFKLAQDYPDTYNQEEAFNWEKIDFKVHPEKYMKTVLNYCLEGNKEVDFEVQRNKYRKWYHAPWLHDDGKYSKGGKYIGNGREFVHGLTRERFTPAYELHAHQSTDLETWAIGFYNERGGYTLNKVWRSGPNPKPELSDFPEGTVAFKLLFTDGTTQQLPFMKGSLEWIANIYPKNPLKISDPELKRVNRSVRLLQIDIAVKDHRAERTGWVFGTFMYNGYSSGSTIWDRLVPVGLSWGDDSAIKDAMRTKGAFINNHLRECYINEKIIEPAGEKEPGALYIRHLGLGGRLNGPVDNPGSSCISCHGRAANDMSGIVASFGKLGNINNYSDDDFGEYFSTVPAGTGKIVQQGRSFTRTDYSMQVAIGIRNYYACRNQSK